jgi:hypothetical protein
VHALRSGMDVKAYAASVGRPRGTVRDEVYAAEVATAVVSDIRHDLSAQFAKLVEIRPAPPWLWPSLVPALLDKHWTVEQTRAVVARLKDLPGDDAALEWTSAAFSDGLVAGTVPPGDLKRIHDLRDRTVLELQQSHTFSASRIRRRIERCDGTRCLRAAGAGGLPSGAASAGHGTRRRPRRRRRATRSWWQSRSLSPARQQSTRSMPT